MKLVACVGLVGACEPEPPLRTQPVRPRAVQQRKPAPPIDAGMATFELREEDFVEDDVRNRDPFRSYAHIFKVSPPKIVQRRVLMPDVAIDDMRVIAIVTRIPQPRAMIVDPAGVGHIVRRGDYIGRAEVVRTGGADGITVTLNWRVERIRPSEVVLVREDPTAPDRAPLRRVLPLHDEEEEATQTLVPSEGS